MGPLACSLVTSLVRFLATCLLYSSASAAQQNGAAARAAPGIPEHYPVPRPLAHAQPTQFELAMLETILGVKEGRFPDPALRKPDGSPGTLLDKMLPDTTKEKERSSMRRQLIASWHTFGATIPFAQGPTLGTFNQSFFRYDSVNLSTWTYVDWRSTAYITPVQTQFFCSNCFITASADTVAMASAIATKQPATPASVQQYCDCSGNGCCQGGWPEDAYAWMTALGNISTKAAYPYWAQDNRPCTLGSNYPVAGNITGWERVPIFSQAALMKAVAMQPVLVYISASSPDFTGYNSTAPGTSGFYVYDGNCTTEVNHAVVVVGYNTQASTPYWIIKNSWPYWGWGDKGYMYIAMYDGPGKCGMLTVNPLYPINFPSAPSLVTTSVGSSYPELEDDSYWSSWKPPSIPNQVFNACSNVINPCGSGACYTSGGIARCNCSLGYVEFVSTPTSKCVSASPCTTSLINPCGAGSCLDVGDGSYVCGCPAGYAIGSQVSGAPTCVPLVQSTKPSTYVTSRGDTCSSVSSQLSVSASTLASLNPFLNCNHKLIPGIVLNIPGVVVNCNQMYAVRPGDTCSAISYSITYQSNFFNWLNPTWWAGQKYNTTPGVTAPSLLYTVPLLSQKATTSSLSTSTSTSTSTSLSTSTSTSLSTSTSTAYSNYDYSQVQALNPALDCTNLYGSQQICVSAPSTVVSSGQCNSTYTTVKGDTCATVQANFKLSSTTFFLLNPGLVCNQYNSGYLLPGLQLCIASTKAAVVNKNCTQYYTVQQGDSCAQIWNAANLSQFQFMYINPGLQCQNPYLYVGQQLCVDSPMLTNIPDPNFVTYTIQPGDTLGAIQASFVSRCTASSITAQSIANQNNIASFVSWTLVPKTTIIIPCVPKIGAACGCFLSLTQCGSGFIPYNSYCDATCNFASPITNDNCTNCQSACALRWGMPPSDPSACTTGYICPFPKWPPTYADSQLSFTCGTNQACPNCYCQYRQAMCNDICGGAGTCYNLCYGAHAAPCAGPSATFSSGSTWPCTSVGTGVSSCPAFPCYTLGKGTYYTCTGWWQNYWSSPPKDLGGPLAGGGWPTGC